MFIRIFSFLALIFISVLFSLPAAVLFFVFCAVVFKRFWEGIAAGLFLDSLYLSPVFFDKYNLGFFTIGFLVCFAAVEWAKYFFQGENIFSKSVIFLVGLASFGLFFAIFT